MIKNISILYPESEFTSDQLQKLSFTGKVSFADSISSGSLSGLVKYLRDADIVAFSPDVFGVNAKKRLSEILEKSLKIKGLALNSTQADYVDADYCLKRNIAISVVPDPSVVAVAEFAVLLLLGSARRIFVDGWQAQKRMYKWELGSELAGKTLGIIGVDAVAERIIRLVKPFGVRIFICNEPPIRVEGAERKSLGEILCSSDLIILNLLNNEKNKGFLSKERINCIKQQAVVVNLSGRSLIDEKAMTEALKSGRINQYVFETDRIKPSPLDKIENAVAFKKLSGYTRESVDRSRGAWVKNIADMAGHPTS